MSDKKKPTRIDVAVISTDNGKQVLIQFSRAINYTILSPEKAAQIAQGILKAVSQINKEKLKQFEIEDLANA